MTRKDLNRRIGKLAFGILKLPEETYRSIVLSIDEKSGGYLRNCSDESAHLILLAVQQMANKDRFHRMEARSKAERKIAKLGYLLKWSWADIAGFVEREVGKRSTRSCTPTELAKIVNGMVATINDRLARGLLQLSQTDLHGFLKHTQSHH